MSTLPIFKKYNDFKAECPGSLLLMRVGDFYEAFGQDARTVANAIGLTITTMGSKRDPDPTPMCGFPYYALEGYLGKLVAAGHRVAVCDANRQD